MATFQKTCNYKALKHDMNLLSCLFSLNMLLCHLCSMHKNLCQPSSTIHSSRYSTCEGGEQEGHEVLHVRVSVTCSRIRRPSKIWRARSGMSWMTSLSLRFLCMSSSFMLAYCCWKPHLRLIERLPKGRHILFVANCWWSRWLRLFTLLCLKNFVDAFKIL